MDFSEIIDSGSIHREMGEVSGIMEEVSGSIIPGKRLRKKAENIVFPNLNIMYLLKGRGIYTDHKGREYDLNPGSAVLRLPGLPHSLEREDRNSWLEFTMLIPRSQYGVLRGLKLIDDETTYLEPGLHSEIISMINKFMELLKTFSKTERELAFLKAQEILFEFLRLHRSNQPATDFAVSKIESAKMMLERDLEIKLKMPGVAKKLGMSYENFRKSFTQKTGASPMNYRIEARLKKAELLLQNPDYSIKQIAYSLGYPDVSDFSRQFKKFKGISPLEFRSGD
jgi:AraC-like DNA-binding protein